MNVNINLKSKKSFIKKLIILILFTVFCFFIKENVLAQDMPTYLSEYYSINTNNYTFECDEDTSTYCNLYTKLSQFFSEFFTLYHYSVLVQNNYSGSLSSYIYFFIDMPNMYYMNSYSGDGYAYYFQKDNTKVPYYFISISEKSKKVSIIYRTGDDGTNGQILKDKYKFYTNFDLYDENGLLINSSSVLEYDYYYNLLPGKTMALRPISCSQGSSGSFSYDSGDLVFSHYNSSSGLWTDDIKLEKPVSSTLTYTFSTLFNGDCSSSFYYIYNYGSSSATIGFSSNDLKIVTFGNLTDSGYDSDGEKIPNHSSDFVDRVNKDNENIFDIILSIPQKIISGFGNLLKDLFVPGDELEDFFNDEYEFILKKLGFLSYPIEVIIDFANRFYSLDDTNSAIFKIPKLEFMGNTLYEGTTFDLMSLINSNDNFKNIYSIYKIAVSGFIVLWLVQLAIKKEQEMFGGGSN